MNPLWQFKSYCKSVHNIETSSNNWGREYYFKKTKQLLGCFLTEEIKHFNIDNTFLIFKKHFYNYKATNFTHNSDSLTSKQREFNPIVVS